VYSTDQRRYGDPNSIQPSQISIVKRSLTLKRRGRGNLKEGEGNENKRGCSLLSANSRQTLSKAFFDLE
jgi:hypothetical protein